MRGAEAGRTDHALPQAGEQLHHPALLHHDPRLDCFADHRYRHLRHHVQEKAELNQFILGYPISPTNLHV